MLAEAALIVSRTSLQPHMRSENQIFDDRLEISTPTGHLCLVRVRTGCREVAPNRLVSRLDIGEIPEHRFILTLNR
jgi:hypothetical protein